MSPLSAMGVFAAVLKASVRADTAYRGAFLARAGEGIASLILSISFYSLIYSQTDGIRGWTYANILALAGTFEIIRGIVHGLFMRNLPSLQDRIRNGDLDYDLITPVNTRFLVSCRRLIVMNALTVLLGVFLVAAGVVAGAGAGEGWPSPAGVAGYLVILVLAGIGNYSLWFLVICLAFWLEKVDGLQEPYLEVLNLSRYPPTVLPPAVRVVATVLLPALVSAALPASVLWGGLGWHLLGFGAGVAGTALLSVLVFRRGLLRYEGGTA